MNRYDQLKYMFDLDLDGTYTELQFKNFLNNYRNAYREVYAMNDGLRSENDMLNRELKKRQDELDVLKINLQQSSLENRSLRIKINTKLSFLERIFGKIKY